MLMYILKSAPQFWRSAGDSISHFCKRLPQHVRLRARATCIMHRRIPHAYYQPEQPAN